MGGSADRYTDRRSTDRYRARWSAGIRILRAPRDTVGKKRIKVKNRISHAFARHWCPTYPVPRSAVPVRVCVSSAQRDPNRSECEQPVSAAARSFVRRRFNDQTGDRPTDRRGAVKGMVGSRTPRTPDVDALLSDI